jgi:hypothetical protein
MRLKLTTRRISILGWEPLLEEAGIAGKLSARTEIRIQNY